MIKKKIIAVISVIIIALPLLSGYALAAPTADISLEILDAVNDGDDIIITAAVSVSAPSESYASLEFNIVSSDYDSLSIVDLNDKEDVTQLDITFASGYGKAIHNGRADGDTGGYRYLTGIFSQTGGNLITDAVDVCSVNLRYSGDEAQTLLIRDFKLVYVDDAGKVMSVPIDSATAVLTIDDNVLTEPIEDGEVPLGTMQPLDEALPPPAGSQSMLWVVIVVLAVIVIALAAVVVILARKRKVAEIPSNTDSEA